jgi:hypothetical protein
LLTQILCRRLSTELGIVRVRVVSPRSTEIQPRFTDLPLHPLAHGSAGATAADVQISII